MKSTDWARCCKICETLRNFFWNSVGESWKPVLMNEFGKPYFLYLCHFILTERAMKTLYPSIIHVFAWTRYCSPGDVKVVIIGQDPYHGEEQAHGLSFSTPLAPPPSLKNIYEEVKLEYPDFTPPNHGNLTPWASQGVLLLNSILTVRAAEPKSHRRQGWETFTNAVIQFLSANYNGIVFMLWGNEAQKKRDLIDHVKHGVLYAGHPSPQNTRNPFLGCGHFRQANNLLGIGRMINWTNLHYP